MSEKETTPDQTKPIEEEAVGPDANDTIDEPKQDLRALSATRRGKLGYCTRKMNEIKQRIQYDRNPDDIQERMKEFNGILNEFKALHETVQMLLPDDVKENENVDWYEPKMAKYDDFISQVDIWLKRHHELPPIDPQSLIDVTDSISRVSKGSKASSTQTVRMKIAVDKAGLLARAKSLREKHEVEMDKVRLQARMEALQLREDLDVTNAKLHALEEIEPMESTSRRSLMTSEDGMNDYFEQYIPRTQDRGGNHGKISGKQQSDRHVSDGFCGTWNCA